MKKMFKEKYPVFATEFNKSDVKFNTTSEIAEFIKSCIEKHQIAKFMTIFDNYEHTNSIGGEIDPDITSAKNIVFCFGRAIPATTVVALRPRAISVCEVGDKFILEYMEAPNEDANTTMQSWIDSLKA
jgi:hypothetical protein